MPVRFYISMFLIMISLTLTGQGITDTIFHIDGVSITAGQIFVKERAGMKVTDVDTTVLQDKRSLSLSDLLSENTSVFIRNNGRGALATASFRGTSTAWPRPRSPRVQRPQHRPERGPRPLRRIAPDPEAAPRHRHM